MTLRVAPMATVETTDADHQGYLLLPRRGADEEAGLQVLRGVAGI